jgi:hypothetical protein
MRRWRENPKNRERERKREIAWRRAHGVKPAIRLTDEERKVLKKLRSRAYAYRRWQEISADPARREQWNAYNRQRYAKKKALAEQNVGNPTC